MVPLAHQKNLEIFREKKGQHQEQGTNPLYCTPEPYLLGHRCCRCQHFFLTNFIDPYPYNTIPPIWTNPGSLTIALAAQCSVLPYYTRSHPRRGLRSIAIILSFPVPILALVVKNFLHEQQRLLLLDEPPPSYGYFTLLVGKSPSYNSFQCRHCD